MVKHGLFLHRGGVLAFALLSVAALLFEIGYQFHVNRRLTLETAESTLTNLASALEASTTRTVQAVDVALASIADVVAVSGLPDDAQERTEILALLQERLRRSPHLRSLMLLDQTGHVVVTTEDVRPNSPSFSAQSFLERDLFRAHLPGRNKGLFIALPVKGRNLVSGEPADDHSGKWILPMSRAVSDAKGALLGVVVAAVNPEYFQSIFQTVQVGRQGTVTLYRYDGVLLSGLPLDPERVGTQSAGSPLFRNQLPAAEFGVFHEAGAGGDTQITAYRATPVWPLVLSVSSEEEEELAGWRAGLTEVGMMAVGFSFVILLFAVTLMRSLSLVHRQGMALEEGNARLNAMLETAVEGILTTRPDGFIESANASAHRIFGYQPGTLVGRPIQDLVPVRQQQAHARILAEIARGERGIGSAFTREVNGMRHNGEVFPLELSVAEVKTRQGPVYATMLRDLSERKRGERALREARDKAEAGQRSKMEFLATMSHEIRTPMNGVIGMTGLLLETRLDEEQRGYAATIRESAESLLVIINDILDFSKIDAGRLDLEISEFELVPLVESVVELLAPRALTKGLELISYVPPALRVPLRGDPGRLRQILINLAGNAVKFTDRGSVAIVVSEDGSDPARVEVRFEVRDTGIGIASADRERLFTMFSQVDGTSARRHGGTGLGLAICKRLTELMGGAIGVNSTPGRGSTFWASIPLERGNATTDTAFTQADWTGRRILLVTGVPVVRDLLVRHLLAYGIEADAVATAVEAMARLKSAQKAGRPFDAAILDDHIPLDGLFPGTASLEDDARDGTTGAELAARIRSTSGLGAVRLALATAQRSDELPDDPVPVDARIVKPIRSKALRACLSRLLAPFAPTQAEVDPGAESPSVARRCRILVVEDNPVNQQVTLAVLRRAGHIAEAVSNGEEAVDAIATIPYDLVLMDVQMPVMDGLTATRVIRLMSGNAGRMPIIAMTANAMQGDDATCLAAGMDDYLPKPITPEQLLHAVARWSAPHAATVEAPAVEPPPPSPATVAVPEAAKEWNEAETETVNRNQLADLREALGDDGLDDLMETFLNDVPKRLERLVRAAEAGDLLVLEQEAHTLKGAAGNVGFDRVSALANRIVVAARRREPANAFPAVVRRLVEAVEESKRDLSVPS